MKKKKFAHKASFHLMINCIFIPLILAVVILTGVSSFAAVKANQETMLSERTLSVLSLTCDYFNNRLTGMVSILIGIRNSSALFSVLRDIDNEGSITPNSYIAMQNYLQSIFSINYAYIDTIAITIEGIPKSIFYESYYPISGIDHTKIEQTNSSVNKTTLSWRNFGSNSPILSTNEKQTAGISLIGTSPMGKNYSIFLEIKEDFIKQAVSNLYRDDLGNVILLDTDNVSFFDLTEATFPINLLHKIKESKTDSGVIQNKKYLVIYDSLKINGWKIAVCYDKEQVFGGIRIMKVLNIFSILAIAILSMGISILFSWIIARPLKRFSKQVAELDLDSLKETHFTNIPTISSEVMLLSESLDHLLLRINNLISDVEKRQSENLKMQNSLLLAQINPHFLYNTLYAIAQECSLGKTSEAEKMLYELSNFFRLGLNAGKEIVPLSDEKDHVTNYLKLIARSFSYVLTYEISIPQELLDCKLPKMTLQTIAENSFKHGLHTRRGNGNIKICATKITDENKLQITIADNGIGIEEHEVAIVREHIKTRNTNLSGFGMYNVNQRIRNTFGDGYGLDITSSKNIGTVVTIIVPIETYKEEDNGKEY